MQAHQWPVAYTAEITTADSFRGQTRKHFKMSDSLLSCYQLMASASEIVLRYESGRNGMIRAENDGEHMGEGSGVGERWRGTGGPCAHSSSAIAVCTTKGLRSPAEEVGVTTSRPRTLSSSSRPRPFRTVTYCRGSLHPVASSRCPHQLAVAPSDKSISAACPHPPLPATTVCAVSYQVVRTQCDTIAPSSSRMLPEVIGVLM